MDSTVSTSNAQASQAEITRRTFVGVAAGAAAAGVAAAAGSASAEEAASTERDPWLPEVWDEEADVVIAGFGAAGVTAAITSCELGMTTVVLEKSPIEDGGNFGCSTGNIHDCLKPDDLDEFKSKVKRLSFNSLPDVDVVDPVIEGMPATYSWLTDELGLQFFEGYMTPNDLHTGGGRFYYKDADGRPTAGNGFFEALAKIAHEKGADIRTSSPITGLVQNPITKEVLGAVYQDAEGATRYIKANRGVIMCCGGYENAPEIQGSFNHSGIHLVPWGTPYNSGDGIKIAELAGAQLWHMEGCEWSICAFRKPTEEAGCAVSMRENGKDPIDPFIHNYLWVNHYGQRFMNETRHLTHDLSTKEFEVWVSSKNEYTNLPFWMVFDSNVFDNVPLYQGTGYWGLLDSYAGVHNLCDWGDDNTKALDNGWIVKADTLEELAGLMHGTNAAGEDVTVDAEGLVAQVAEYNAMAEAGADTAFKREGIQALSEEGPYYAIELCTCAINTQGGPRRDGQCRTIDPNGNPIPRLYNCGEFGSMNNFVYVLGNICEALTTGRLAAQDVATLDPQA